MCYRLSNNYVHQIFIHILVNYTRQFYNCLPKCDSKLILRKYLDSNSWTCIYTTTYLLYSPILSRSILFCLSAIIKTVIYNKAYNIRMPLYAFADGPTKTLYKVHCSSIGSSKTTVLPVKWKNIIIETRGGIVFLFRLMNRLRGHLRTERISTTLYIGLIVKSKRHADNVVDDLLLLVYKPQRNVPNTGQLFSNCHRKPKHFSGILWIHKSCMNLSLNSSYISP